MQIYQSDRLTVEVDPATEILRINGVECCPEFFELLVDPDPTKYYQLHKEKNGAVIFETFEVGRAAA